MKYFTNEYVEGFAGECARAKKKGCPIDPRQLLDQLSAEQATDLKSALAMENGDSLPGGALSFLSHYRSVKMK